MWHPHLLHLLPPLPGDLAPPTPLPCAAHPTLGPKRLLPRPHRRCLRHCRCQFPVLLPLQSQF